MSEWGNPAVWRTVIHIVLCGGEPRELKHLSTGRKRKQNVIPPVAASERGIAQTVRVSLRVRGCRCGAKAYMRGERNVLESSSAEGERPVREASSGASRYLSSAGHVEPRVNPAGPSAKAKHSPETDSEQVP